MKKQPSRRDAAVAPRAAGEDPSSPDRPNGLLSTLGLHGLAHLDAPVLAALATETPMLLIGPHGCAKSALLERLAAAMGLEHRHYNASLLSFDDLVGFPVPDGDGLRYLRTPATLWGAQSVFLDEISRCRPEVQNKLFSIVHERRVQGIALGALRYRWAAMNPPAGPETADAADELDVYVGSLPLDPALADRFGFVLNLPALEDLSPEARRSVIRSGLTPADRQAAAMDVPALVADCRQGAERTAAPTSRHATRSARTSAPRPTRSATPISGWNSHAAASHTSKVSASTHPTSGPARRATSSSD